MISRWLLVVLAVAGSIAFGTAIYWAGTLPVGFFQDAPIGRWALVLGVTAGATTGYFGVRWLRWHFLVRRFFRAIPARDSLVLYFATLPALLTPFAIAELLRILPLRKRSPSATRFLFLVWVLERFYELAVVVSIAAFHQGVGWSLAVLSAALVVGIAVDPWLTRRGRRRSVLGFAPITLLLSVLGWGLLLGAYFVAVFEVSNHAPNRTAIAALGTAVLEGGVSGLPLGMGVTSSVLILGLTKAGIDQSASIVAVALFRIGTAWYAVALALTLAVVWKKHLLALVRDAPPPDHFDAIAHEYPSLIPEHVQQRLLGRKIDAIVRVLQNQGIVSGARGLDIGCGQGTYARELARRGFQMSGVDPSRGQIDSARRSFVERPVDVELRQAAATSLPFPTGSYDFAYLVNVIHHVPTADRERALLEAVRVLRTGGVLLLHEINTQNPVFRFYMGYVFPLLRKIDDGTEEWILPSDLPKVPGQAWVPRLVFFTFLPEFLPKVLFQWFSGLESWLERSQLRRYSAHFMAVLIKTPSDSPRALE